MATNITTTQAFNEDFVTISGTCEVTGDLYEVKVPYDEWRAWRSGQYAQNALRSLTADQREFLISRTTPAEWDLMTQDCDE